MTAKEQRVVILRAFIKKTEKTPAGEIDLALQRAKELKPWTKISELHRRWSKDTDYKAVVS
jgi:phage-related protein